MTVAQRSRAAESIARKGQTVTIVGASSATYDPATGTTTSTAYSKTAKAVPGLPLSPFRKSGNSSIVEGDQQMLLAGLDTSGTALPQSPVNSVVTLADGTTKLTLIAVESLDPDGEGSIIYDCIVRRQA
jgi:hypothetical protein